MSISWLRLNSCGQHQSPPVKTNPPMVEAQSVTADDDDYGLRIRNLVQVMQTYEVPTQDTHHVFILPVDKCHTCHQAALEAAMETAQKTRSAVCFILSKPDDVILAQLEGKRKSRPWTVLTDERVQLAKNGFEFMNILHVVVAGDSVVRWEFL